MKKKNPSSENAGFEKQRTLPKSKTRVIRVLLSLAFVLAISMFAFWFVCIRMPGQSYVSAQEKENQTELQSKSANATQEKAQAEQAKKVDGTEQAEAASGLDKAEQKALEKREARRKAFEKEANAYVVHLADTIGERNLGKYKALCDSADYIEKLFKDFGYQPTRQTFKARGLDCFNIEVEIKGTTKPDEIVIIGGHYDSAEGTPGANDNGSGTAAMLVLANHFKNYKPERTLRFVAWTNEEPPYFQVRDEMGSLVHAEKCRKEDLNIIGVVSLETMGFFTDKPNSQKYPAPLNLLYPTTGNFIGFVSDVKSGRFERQIIDKFREHAKIPSEGASLPGEVQGVGWSDHWSYWQEGYRGIMVTDTAPYRYPHYHKATDTPDKINYPEYSKVINALVDVVEDLVKKQ